METESIGSDSLELAADEEIELIRFGDLKEGDVLIGSSGRTTVVEGYALHTPDSMYVLETASGVEIEVSGNHLLYVVTANDRDLHRGRLVEGKRLGKTVPGELLRELEGFAEENSPKEALIADFEHFLGDRGFDLRNVLIRVAEAIGPVSESQLYIDDLELGIEPSYSVAIQNYNRSRFAQQLLSVLNIGKARKRWPTIVGTVMTAEMLLSYDPEDIYIPDPPMVLEETVNG